jgi:acetylornithine deacetylase/succinyl-diaminopimelate desuccinylase-like protein
VLILWVGSSAVFEVKAADAEDVRAKVRAWRTENEVAVLREFADLLSLPNVAADRANIRKNAEHIVAMLERRGAETRLLEVQGSPPAIYGQLNTPGATRTIAFYAHYDGQPVNPTEWASGPWEPTLRHKLLEDGGKQIPWDSLQSPIDGEWRLYARSTGDDKAPIIGMLAAIDSLRNRGIPLSVNVKFFFDGEEEAGSPHLAAIVRRYADLLEADAWIFCDGPVHQTRRMQVYFGARGITGLEITTYGATRTLHSGHYGNWAPNPAVLLAHLVTSMRDTEGNILIEGFSDDVRPLTPSERRALAEIPPADDALRHTLGLARTEGGGKPLADRIMLPAVNLRGIRAGNVGAKTTNAIPTEATATIGLRLVPEQTPERVRVKVEEHFRKQGYHLVRETPDLETRRKHPKILKVQWRKGGYPPARTSMDLPVSRALVQVIEDALEKPVVRLPSLGGSIPMHRFPEILGVPVIGLPIANHDNNQHAANENLRVQNLWDAIEIYAALFARLGEVWR